MSFKLDITQEQRIRQDRISSEIVRLYGLTDRWLGQEILQLARQGRQDRQDKLSDPGNENYDTSFVWNLAPEIARRLGAGPLQLNESRSIRLRSASDRELREMTGLFLSNNSLDRMSRNFDMSYEDALCSRVSESLEILGREFVNGNPIAIAIDRICEPAPADNDRRDWIARHTREIARYRFGKNVQDNIEVDKWSPNFQKENSFAYNVQKEMHESEVVSVALSQ